MNDESTCKIETPQITNPTADSPHPMGKWKIYEDDPEYDKSSVCGEPKSLGNSTCDESGGDDGKHHLEYHKGLVRNCWTVNGMRLKSYAS